MISNEFQYNLTKNQAARFEQALAGLDESVQTTTQAHPLLRKAERDAMLSQLESLKAEIAEYEALRSGRRRSFSTESFDELPQVLIKARIASGLTQKQLAERLGLKEQQVQRYEATAYAHASLKRVNEVIHALGLKVRDEVVVG